MKLVDLLNQYMITEIELNLWAVSDKPTMKSMLMSSHFQSGILRGCNNPLGFM
jgi:hypothetical protein